MYLTLIIAFLLVAFVFFILWKVYRMQHKLLAADNLPASAELKPVKFTYETQKIDMGMYNIADVLNDRGEAGWQLVHMVTENKEYKEEQPGRTFPVVEIRTYAKFIFMKQVQAA